MGDDAGVTRLLDRVFDPGLTRRVFRISLPMIISELSYSLYALTDTFFVSGLGRLALASVGLASYLSWLFFVVISMFYTGVLVYVAQASGAGKAMDGRRGLGEALLYGALFAGILGLVGFYIAPYILLLQSGDPVIAEMATRYFRMRMYGMPFSMIVWSMDAGLRAIGATRESMYANLFGVTLNIVLDPIMIYGLLGFPRLGVVGAALATVVSIIAMMPIEHYYLIRKGLSPVSSIKPHHLLRIIDLGLPVMAERLVFSAGNNIYISLVARCGSPALAAHNIGIRIESIVYMPGFAFSMAASALVGQEVGAGRISEAEKIGWETIKIGTFFMLITGIGLALLSSIVTIPFSPDPETHSLATIYLVLAGLSEPGLALAMITGGAIRGAGNTRIPLVINAAGLYLFRITPASILVPELGAIGAWLAMAVDVYLRGIIFLVIYNKKFDSLVRKVIL